MQTQTALQEKVARRAEEFAHLRHYGGPARFQRCDLDKALAELSPEERLAERGLDTKRSGTQREAASRHFAEEVAKHRACGLPNDLAIAFARVAEPHALRQRRAGSPIDRGPHEGAQHFSLFFRDTAHRSYTVSNTVEQDKADTLRDVVVKRIAADCLHRGVNDPDQSHRLWADSWFAVVSPPPPPGASPAVLSAYNRQRETTINTLLADVRALLRDPEQAAKLRPTVLR